MGAPSPYGPTDTASRTVRNLRCTCGKLLAEMVTAPYRIVCYRCKVVNSQD